MAAWRRTCIFIEIGSNMSIGSWTIVIVFTWLWKITELNPDASAQGTSVGFSVQTEKIPGRMSQGDDELSINSL